jgi:hypothetical protein
MRCPKMILNSKDSLTRIRKQSIQISAPSFQECNLKRKNKDTKLLVTNWKTSFGI